MHCAIPKTPDHSCDAGSSEASQNRYYHVLHAVLMQVYMQSPCKCATRPCKDAGGRTSPCHMHYYIMHALLLFALAELTVAKVT